MPKREQKIAYIEHIVTDQGNGGAHCSNCKNDLTNLSRKQSERLFYLCKSLSGKGKGEEPIPYKEEDLNHCPGCGYELKEGGTWINWGGSDF